MSRSYKYITSRTSPNRSSRKGHKVASITVHWWGNPVGQKIGGIVDWLCNPRAGASAHYVVSGDTVYCIVDPDQKAWHSGSNRGNLTSIGLELDPNASMRESTEKTAAALIADLRATYGDLPLSPHRRWTSTQCPGDWDLARLDRLARGQKLAPRPAPAPKPAPKPGPAKTGKLEVDGRWGKATSSELQRRLGVVVDGRAGVGTWKALQRKLGHPVVDGLIEHQSYKADELGNGIVPKYWKFSGRGSKGSKTIKRLQAKLGVTADGVVGSGTVTALQRKLNADKNFLR